MTGVWGWKAAQAAIAIVLLALLWQAADGPAALQSLMAADWIWLVAAVVAMTLQTILSAFRWQLTASQLGMSFDTRYAISEYYLAQVVNQSLPGGVIGDAGRAFRARAQAGLLVSGQAVMIERLLGQIALFLTMACAFMVTSLIPGGLDWPRWLGVPVSFMILAGLAVPLAIWIASRFDGAIGRAAVGLSRLIAKTVSGPQVLTSQVLLSGGTMLCNLAAFAFCVRAVGVALPLTVVLSVVPLILFTMLIPISVAGWGLREGAAAALLPLANVAVSDALASSVAFGLCFVAAALPGLIFLRFAPQQIRQNSA